MSEDKSKSEQEWKAVLSPAQVRVSLLHTYSACIIDTLTLKQFKILRQKGTEPPGTGEYDKFYDDGVYSCAGCGTALYKSTTKFKVRT